MKILFCLFLTALAKIAYPQDCKNFYYMINNAEVQMTLFDRNGSKSGVQTWKISDVKNDGKGFSSAVVSSMADAKGRELGKGSGIFKCDGGKLMADMRMAMPHDPAQPYNNTEAKLGDAYVEYPSALSEGMQLQDATMDLNINNNGMPTTAHFSMTNRKVVGQEKVTSDAGSWDAYKITYDASLKMRVMGIGIPINTKVTEWFVQNFGVVKTESYSKNGKKIGSTLLTALKK